MFAVIDRSSGRFWQPLPLLLLAFCLLVFAVSLQARERRQAPPLPFFEKPEEFYPPLARFIKSEPLPMPVEDR